MINVLAYASEARLLLEADRLDKLTLVDEGKLKEADIAANKVLQDAGLVFEYQNDVSASNGVDSIRSPRTLEGDELAIPPEPRSFFTAWMPDHILRFFTRSFRPYEAVHAAYHSPHRYPAGSPQATKLSTLFATSPSTGRILGTNDALVLLKNIIQGKADSCAKLNTDRLMTAKEGKLIAFFPGHRASERNDLIKKWSHWSVLPWNQPLGDIRAYLGERITLYFAFVGWLCVTITVPAVFGIGVFVVQANNGEPTLSWLPLFALVVMFWSTYLVLFWGSKEKDLAVQWGTFLFSKNQERRAQYLESDAVTDQRSYVTGKQSQTADPLVTRLRRGASTTAVTLAVGAVTVIIISLFTARVFLEREERDGNLAEGWGGYLASFLNALQIQLCGFLYTKMAVALTNMETHETDGAHQDSLVLKNAVFQLINANGSLFWVAFVKGTRVNIFGEEQTCTEDDNGNPDCLAELQSHLAILFLTRLIVNNLQELLQPAITRWVMAAVTRWRTPEGERGLGVDGEPLGRVTPYEEEAAKAPYDVAEDWLELTVILAYSMLFVVAFPLAPLITLVLFYVEQRVDMFNAISGNQRPVPSPAASIGTWGPFLRGLTYLSVVTNTSVAIFSASDKFVGLDTTSSKFVAFVLIEHGIFLAKVVFESAFAFAPEHVTRQLDRQEYLVDKHFNGVADEIDRIHVIEEDDEEEGAEGALQAAEGGAAGVSGAGMVAATDLVAGAEGGAYTKRHFASHHTGSTHRRVASGASSTGAFGAGGMATFVIAGEHDEVQYVAVGREMRLAETVPVAPSTAAAQALGAIVTQDAPSEEQEVAVEAAQGAAEAAADAASAAADAEVEEAAVEAADVAAEVEESDGATANAVADTAGSDHGSKE